jgi:hypothetical protein
MQLGSGAVGAPPLPGPFRALAALLARIAATFGPLWRLLRELLAAFFGRKGRAVNVRSWVIVRRAKSRAVEREAHVSEADTRRLLERMKEMNDSALLAEKAVHFAGEGADFFADPREVERIIEALIRENPPFLHIAREGAAPEEQAEGGRSTEYVEREMDVVVTEPMTLFIPQAGVEHRESNRPPGYPLLRNARSLADLRSIPMLHQSLPEDLLFARLLEGSARSARPCCSGRRTGWSAVWSTARAASPSRLRRAASPRAHG